MRKTDQNIQTTIEELEKKNGQLENQMKTLHLKLQWYEEQFRLSQQKRFGSSSEKTDENQLTLQLFNEAEVSFSVLLAEPTKEMSTQVRKELTIIPAQVKVTEHVQHIYSCRHCENHFLATPIVKAKMPKPGYPEGTCIAFCCCVHHDSKICGWIATLSTGETVGANGNPIELSDTFELDDLEYDEMVKTIL